MSRPSYAHGASAVPLLGETIGENLRRTVERCGGREALVVPSQGFRATYRQLWDATTALAKALLRRGIERGDRVGVWSPNRFEWVVIQYATARIGAILVNVNPAYQARELQHALNQSGVRLLLLSQGFRERDYVETVERVRPACPALEETVVLDHAWAALLEEGAPVEDGDLASREAALTFDDPINIQYTSGTTGAPKGATLSHHNVLNNGFFCGEVLGYTERDRVCIPVPFYHCFGMVIWSSATSPAPPTARASSRRARRSCPTGPWPRSRPSGARRSTACPRCSSPSSTTPTSAAPTSRRSAPGSWRGLRVPPRS